MEIILTTAEIRAILKACQQTLRLLQSTTEYRQIERSEYFATSNEVVLNDALNVLFEVIGAIEDMQINHTKSEGLDGATNQRSNWTGLDGATNQRSNWTG